MTVWGPGGTHSQCGTAADKFPFTLPHIPYVPTVTYSFIVWQHVTLWVMCSHLPTDRAEWIWLYKKVQKKKQEVSASLHMFRDLFLWFSWRKRETTDMSGGNVFFLLLHFSQDSIPISIYQGRKKGAQPLPHHLCHYRIRTPTTTTLYTPKVLPL